MIFSLLFVEKDSFKYFFLYSLKTAILADAMSENTNEENAGEQPVVNISNDVDESREENKDCNDVSGQFENTEKQDTISVDDTEKTKEIEEVPEAPVNVDDSVNLVENDEEALKMKEFTADLKLLGDTSGSAPVELSDTPSSEEKFDAKPEERIEPQNDAAVTQKEDENVSCKENIDKINVPNDDVIFVKPKDKERNHCYW